MTTILVTGGNGQLASCIKDVEKEYDDLNIIYTDHLELDICELNQIQTFFKSNPQINYCINCAAYTAVDKAETEAEKAFEINATGAKNLAQVCNDHDAILIHVSTDFVFDGEKNEPYTETDAANPISVYGASKLQGEVEIQQALKEHFIIRTSWLYSEYGNNFMKTMLRLAETRDGISVVSDQIGTPTYAGDLAEIIIQIINTKTEKYGIYHYSNEGVASWFEFAKEIFKLAKNKIKVNPIPSIEYLTPAKRPKYSVLDKKKIIDVFKIDIPFWRESLKKVILQGTFQ
ncbi:dTDP-4-dehydrorhamnose reductase [uncultured Algibacter sp.]|uniref:dTDP-4-dehydrorhamnose reductase n=1 Tax=uncultured Algibacter sp. TaxID=298659 RepID=UPI0025EF7750|nr:dTDP-4-dehydrorhamnose reductase [uncultured Algibacter sp.]